MKIIILDLNPMMENGVKIYLDNADCADPKKQK